jgi:hypothetical protein
MAKKPRKSMDDPRNWGMGGGEPDRPADARGPDPHAPAAPGRRDPRSIGAPRQAPTDWGDFEWTPPRDLRPPDEEPAPAETTAAGAWKDFDTMYPEEPAAAAPPAPADDWYDVAPRPADGPRDRTDAPAAAYPPRRPSGEYPPAGDRGAATPPDDDEWRWVAPSGPPAPASAGGYDAEPAGSPYERAAGPAAYEAAPYGDAAGDAGPYAEAGVSPHAAQPAGRPAAGAGGERRQYHSYRSSGGRAASRSAGGAGGSGSGGGRPQSPDDIPTLDPPNGRRLVPAGSILIALIIGLALAALLNAQSLQRAAESMHVGPLRTVMLGLVKPVEAVSSTLRLDRPRAAIEDALGRGSQEQAGTHTRPGDEETATPSAKPSPGKSGKPAASPSAALFTPTEDHELALWVGGDSMAMVFGESVVAMADQTGVIDSALDYHVSSGLSRPDFFNWPNRIRAEMKSFRPDVAVFASGANDGQGFEYEGQVLSYGSKEWLEVYAKRVGAAMDLLGEKGKRQVWWIGMPVARDPEQSAIYRTLNKVYAAEAKKRPFVHYMDTYEMFSDENGNYNDYLTGLSGKTELMRQGDGIHWSRAGGDLAAAELLEQIAKLYKFKFEP